MHAVDQLLAQPGEREALLEALQAPYARPTLRCAKIKVTARCNLKCAFCDYWRMREPDELSTEEYCRLLDQFAAAGCTKVHLSGGEATLRKDIFQLLAHTAGLGMKANMTTNGTTLTPERAAKVVDAGTHSVSLSLDGPDSRSHDALRGVPGAFEKTFKGIRMLAKARDKAKSKMKLRLNTVLTRHNFRRLPELIELAAELGMVEVHPMPVDERGEDPEHRLKPRDIDEFNTTIAPVALEMRQRLGFSTAPHLVWPLGRSEREISYSARGKYAQGYFEQRTCYVPWLHMFVAWNGDVYLCCMARNKTDPLGNLRRNTVQEIFDGEPYRRIRRQFLTEMPKVCHRCDMFVHENAAVETALGEHAPRVQRSGPGVEMRTQRVIGPRHPQYALPVVG
jgi:radical SAM protein with 4Fe4S-binding SPASM domain